MTPSESDKSRQSLDLSPERRALLKKKMVEIGLKIREDSIRPRDKSKPAPLSFAQQRLWFLHQLAPDNSFYNVPVIIRLKGHIDGQALRESLTKLMVRHEVLRTSFPLEYDLPVQIIEENIAVPLTVFDLQAKPAHQRRAEAERLADLQAKMPFDLQTGPVFRAALVTLSSVENWLLLTFHHIIIDGWSMGILVHELSEFYRAATEGRTTTLPELRIQYADFACWQREWLQGERLERQLDYWRTQLADLSPLKLVTDHPRAATPTFEGTTYRFEIPVSVTKNLRQLAEETGTTLYMVLLAGFQTLLARYTGQDDIVVGSPIANRTRSELEALIGFFVNTLVMRGNLSGDPTFRTFLAQTRRTALDAFANQDVPFEKLVEELQPDRDISRNPLFQVGFVLQTAWNLEGKSKSAIDASDDNSMPEIQRGTSIFDLAAHLWEKGESIHGVIEYSTTLFEAATIARFIDHFMILLQAIVREPETPISNLPLMSVQERHRLVVDWNSTQAPFDEAACFHHLFEQQAFRFSEHVALQYVNTQLSYRELNERANALAHILHDAGASTDKLVLLCLERSPEMIIALLAILKAGAAFVPLDPKYPAERLDFMVQDTGASLMITSAYSYETLFSGLLTTDVLDTILIDKIDAQLASAPTTNPKFDVEPHNLAYVIYTSGTTGQPKGVLIEHRGLCNVAAAQQRIFGLQPASRVLQFASISFDASIFEISMAFGSGGSLYLAPSEMLLPGPALADFLRQQSISIVTLPPSALAAMPQEHLPDLEIITVAGEACPSSLVDTWGVERRFYNLYGPTEGTIWSTWSECKGGDDKPSIGKPIPNTSTYILDDHSRPVPIGVPGELHIGGVGLARGYLDRPQLTEERFVTIEIEEGTFVRLYRTGDIARYLANGNIDFLGRVDHQVKVRGFRIELEEVETVLRDHPSLQDAVVVTHDDQTGDTRLIAYVTPSHDFSTVDEKTARELEAEQLSYWKQIYDENYSDTDEHSDSTFNISGWNNSYTGEPFPKEVMRQWVDSTVTRVRNLEPKRILELGCGSGLLLFRIAPDCGAYTATDFSKAALAYIERHRGQLGRSSNHVRLLNRAANDFDGIEQNSYDLVILNSVVQYFPSVDYLLDVLAMVVKALAPDGKIFLGDLRNLALLETLALSIEMARADVSDTVAELNERTHRRMMLEQELVIDPEFFYALRLELPDIQEVEVLLKRGTYRNELTKYRYDVVLHVGQSPQHAVETGKLVWSKDIESLDALRKHLLATTPNVLHIVDIPNDRLTEDLQVREVLSRLKDTDSVGELQSRTFEMPPGQDPEAVATLAQSLGYEAELYESWKRGIGVFDARLWRSGSSRVVSQSPASTGHLKPWSHFTNTPYRGIFLRKMVPRIRDFLTARLPDFMVPSRYVLLDNIPHTSSGKVDRSKLPDPGHARPDLGVEYTAPAIEIEKNLASIWGEVLGVSRVGLHDNFFELGGDSILGIQIVSRARQVGIKIEPKHLFEYQTIAELAKVCMSAELVTDYQGVVKGEVPLTPIQHWFFEQDLDDHHHFNQAVFLELHQPLDPARLQESLRYIQQHHDALRLRFERTESGWQQFNMAEDTACPLGQLDLTGIPLAERESALAEAVATTHASLNITEGPVLRALLAKFGQSFPDRLLLVAHHLVIDAVSWRILLQDITTVYRQLMNEELVTLPAKTASYKRWSELLSRFAPTADLRQELAFWTKHHAAQSPPLPIDFEGSENRVSSVETINVTLESPATDVLLGRLATLFNIRFEEVLIAALAHAISEWTGQDSVLIDLEGHGRESLFDDVDVSRTIGWFTSIAPVRLMIPATDIDTLAMSVKDQLRAIPNRGISYGILRYLGGEGTKRRLLASLREPEIAFNYLGRFGGQEGVQGTVADDMMAVGATRSPRGRRLHKLEVNAHVLDGRLFINFDFSTEIHKRETIEKVATNCQEALRQLVQLGETATESRKTTSDFELARLNQRDFGKLMEHLARRDQKDE